MPAGTGSAHRVVTAGKRGTQQSLQPERVPKVLKEN